MFDAWLYSMVENLRLILAQVLTISSMGLNIVLEVKLLILYFVVFDTGSKNDPLL